MNPFSLLSQRSRGQAVIALLVLLGAILFWTVLYLDARTFASTKAKLQKAINAACNQSTHLAQTERWSIDQGRKKTREILVRQIQSSGLNLDHVEISVHADNSICPPVCPAQLLKFRISAKLSGVRTFLWTQLPKFRGKIITLTADCPLAGSEADRAYFIEIDARESDRSNQEDSKAQRAESSSSACRHHEDCKSQCCHQGTCDTAAWCGGAPSFFGRKDRGQSPPFDPPPKAHRMLCSQSCQLAGAKPPAALREDLVYCPDKVLNECHLRNPSDTTSDCIQHIRDGFCMGKGWRDKCRRETDDFLQLEGMAFDTSGGLRCSLLDKEPTVQSEYGRQCGPAWGGFFRDCEFLEFETTRGCQKVKASDAETGTVCKPICDFDGLCEILAGEGSLWCSDCPSTSVV